MKLLSSLLHADVAAIFLFLAAGTYIIYQVFLCPLAKIPGPFWAKLTNLHRVYITARADSHRKYITLHKKYGPVVRVGPNDLSVADPEAFQKIYKAGSKYYKSATYDVFKGTRPFDLTGQRDERIHSEQRRLVARAYSMDSMVHLEPKVDSMITALVERLGGLSGDVDLGAWMQLFAFDVIGAVSFSQEFGYIHAGDDQGVFKRIERAFGSLAWLKYARWFYSMHETLKPYIGNWLAANDRNGHFYNFSRQELEARKNRVGDEKDILSQLFTVQKTKPELTDTNIAFMMTSNVFAGSDTTSISLRAIFYLLLTHLGCYQRLMRELEEKKSMGELSDPVTFQEAQSCTYLQAVMYEALRLYPPSGSTLNRDVPAGGLQIGEYYIPERTLVGTSAWAIHRVPEIWGEDVEDFRPERWLDEKNANIMKRFFFAFGGGSRTCIGRNISWLEMSKVIPTLLMRFDMELAPDALLTERCGAFVYLRGLEVRLSSRG